MEATFVLTPEELTPEWLDQLKRQFAPGDTITIKATGPEKSLTKEEQRVATQRAMLTRLRAIPPRQVEGPIDVNSLIDEMYEPNG